MLSTIKQRKKCFHKTEEGTRWMKNTVFRIFVFLLVLSALSFIFTGCDGSKSSDFTLPTRSLPDKAERLSYESFRYSVYDDDTIIITEYVGVPETVVIPDKIDGMPVVELTAELFYQNQTIVSVTIGKYVEMIGTNCFGGCSYLASVTMGDRVWSIGAYAFTGTPWFDALTQGYETEDGTVVVPDEFVILGNGVLVEYTGNDKSIVIPDTVYHLSNVFEMSDIISVKMSDSVRTIGENTFAFCASLSLIDFSNSLLSIGDGAFYGCSGLTTVSIPETVETIGKNAFYECLYLNDVTLGNSLSSMGTYAFYNCSQMQMIYFPTSLEEIPVGAFEGCASLGMVFYAGDEKAFRAIVADTTNYLLLDATIIYNATNGR